MQLYELINFSDATTFYAPDFLTAALAAGIVGQGAYGCKEVPGEGPSMPPLVRDEWFTAEFGKDFGALLDEMDKPKVIAALRSFAYTSASVNRRKEYDELIEGAVYPEARRKQWEDEHRSSMNQIVSAAWQHADALQKILDKEPALVP